VAFSGPVLGERVVALDQPVLGLLENWSASFGMLSRVADAVASGDSGVEWIDGVDCPGSDSSAHGASPSRPPPASLARRDP
jgi:hypothetical protein